MTGHLSPTSATVSTREQAVRRRRRMLLGRSTVLGIDVVLWLAAWWAARSESPSWATVCGTGALLLGLGLLASQLVGRKLVAVTVRGTSMEPTYRHGDRVLVRRTRTVRRGEVVVVEQPTRDGVWLETPLRPAVGSAAVLRRRWLIKRVVAVSGDQTPRHLGTALANSPEDRVPAGKLVLLGDNHETSHDSRQLGYFPADRVLGIVLRTRQRVAQAQLPRMTQRSWRVD